MKLKKIDREKIREMDVVLTTSDGILAYIIRAVTASVKMRWNTGIATHAGLIVRHGGSWMIAESCGKNGGGVISPLTKYETGKRFAPGFVAVRRSYGYGNYKRRRAASDRVIEHIPLINYDYTGATAFTGIFKENRQRFYCSELVRYEYGLDNVVLCWQKKLVSPYDLQKSINLKDVSGALI